MKSVTNLPDAYLNVIDKRYLTVINGFTNTNWYDVQQRKQAIYQMVHLFGEAEVNISAQELESIILEVQAHPNELKTSLVNITNAFKSFKLKVL